MIKVHHPEFDQEELIKAAGRVATLIEGNSHIKEASSSAISRDLIANNMPDKDHFMVHLVAMGDGEAYGPNRNGDYWPKKANQTYHDTFVSNGHFFREHNNRDPKEAIGIVKASAYNEDMNRIELIIHGDKTKAEEEYSLAKEGKALSFSMSARVPNDRCNICSNVATKSANYCTHLKHKMNQYLPEFQKYAYAINDKPTFFDISRVKNPADRIAHYLDYGFDNDLKKAASVGGVIFSDELAKAEGVVIPDVASLPSEDIKILEKLASAEAYLKDYLNGADIPKDERYNFVKYALESLNTGEDVSQEEMNAIRSIQPGTLFYKFAKAGTILPFGAFMSYVRDKSISDTLASDFYKAACSCCSGDDKGMLGGMFGKLLNMGGSCGGVSMGDADSMFGASPKSIAMSDEGGDEVQSLMDSVSNRHDHLKKPDVTRIVRITISQPMGSIKMASTQTSDYEASTLDEAEKSVALYGMYKVAAIKSRLKADPNFVFDDSAALRLAYQSIA